MTTRCPAGNAFHEVTHTHTRFEEKHMLGIIPLLAMTDHLITVAISVAGPIILAILGFLLKLYSTISLHSKQLEGHERRIASNANKLEKLSDKQYSIVRTMPRD